MTIKNIVLGAISFTLLLVIVTTAFAWKAPVLTAQCAPGTTARAFEITLNPESNQKIELSYSNLFTPLIETKDFGTDGTHAFTEPAQSGAINLYARYADDHNAKAHVAVDDTLCTPPTTPPSTPPSNPPSNDDHKHGSKTIGSMMYPCHYFANATPTCQTTPDQQRQWDTNREDIMTAWRCRTFGGDYCPKIPPTPNKPIIRTPAEIHGK